MRGLLTVPQAVSISRGQSSAQSSSDYAARLLALEDRIAAAESKGALIRMNLTRIPSDASPSSTQGAQRSELQAQLVANEAQVASLKRSLQDARADARQSVGLADVGVTVTPQVARTSVQPPAFRISREAMMISGVFTVFVLGPLAIAFAIRLVRRGWTAQPEPQLTDMSDRVRRIEAAVETIAIEVERVSESQRYLVRSLSDEAKLPAPKG